MFDILQRLRQLHRSFTMLDGNGSVCGPYGNACSPEASNMQHKRKSPIPKAQNFLGSVFGHSSSTSSHSASGNGIDSLSSGIGSNGFGSNGFGSNGSSGSGFGWGAGNRAGNGARGGFGGAGGAAGGSGSLVQNTAVVSYVNHLYGKTNNLRGAKLNLPAGVNLNGDGSHWLLSGSKLRASVISQPTHSTKLDSKLINPTQLRGAMAVPVPANIGKSKKEWRVFLNAPNGKISGNASLISIGKSTVDSNTVSSSSAASSKSFSSYPKERGDWWNHSATNSIWALPKTIKAVDAGSGTGGIGGSHGNNNNSRSKKGKKGSDICTGTCYFAPQPITQSTVVVYHSV